MSQNLPNMLDSTIAKLREMVNANTVVGEPITTGDGVTIIPVSKISIGFGGGLGAGMKVTPVAFLVINQGNVRMIPVATPANTTADRIVEMVPDTLDKIVSFVDSKMEKK